jgi:hypothetical protein
VTTAATYLPTIPAGLIESLPDSGRWRELGITHWHLWSHDSAVTNTDRFTKDIVAARILNGEPESDPRAALEWVLTQQIQGMIRGPRPQQCAWHRRWRDEASFRESIEFSWDLMTHRPHLLTPIGGGLAVRVGWSLDVYAEPMNRGRCLRH